MSLMTVTRFAPPRREARTETDAPQKPATRPLRAVASAHSIPASPASRPVEVLRAERGDAGVLPQERRPERRGTGQPAEPKAAWLAGKGGGLPRKGVNRQQFLRELDAFQHQQFAGEARKTVMDVSAAEIEGIVIIAAKLRGRYLAKVLDAGAAGRGPVTEGEMREIARCREMYEEARRGVEELKHALEQGEILLQGVING